MIKKITDIGAQIKHFVLPIKGHSELSAYQNNIVYSVFVFIICFVASLITHFASNQKSSLLENYLVGIACSIIVVLFTTIIQYSKEHSKLWKEYDELVFQLLIQMALLTDSKNKNMIEINYDRFVRAYDDFSNLGFSMYWFDLRKENLYLKISTELTRVFLIIEKSDLDVKEKLKRIDKGDYYSVCLECMAQLSRDERFNKYEFILKKK